MNRAEEKHIPENGNQDYAEDMSGAGDEQVRRDKNPGTTGTEEELQEIRNAIDSVDIRIRELFLERMKLAKRVAEVKARSEDRIYKPDREAVILDRRSEGMDSSVIMEYRALLRRMMEVSRKYQYGLTLKMRDCFPFPFETEEQSAAGKIAMIRPEVYICDFCPRDEVMAAVSWQQVREWIDLGRADFGAGIIEKIGIGVSDELNTLLVRDHLYIRKCSVITQEDGKYKLVLFSKTLCVLPEHNRLKIVFVARNRSGALGSILSMIADYAVNLTEIHSIPYQTGSDWNYRFFAELEMNLLSEEAQALIFQLSQETLEFQILGSYRCVGDFVS